MEIEREDFDYLFKLLVIGDSGTGKSSLLLSYTSDDPPEEPRITIGMDYQIKYVTAQDKKLKLVIWDTGGHERFRTLQASYYRRTQGIIMVYDVTRRHTFTNLFDEWAKQIELHSTNEDCIKMLVGNKVDLKADRVVTKKEGMDFAQKHGCLFMECSAVTGANVQQCFEELVVQILDTPSLLASCNKGVSKNVVNISKDKDENKPPGSKSGCCTC